VALQKEAGGAMRRRKRGYSADCRLSASRLTGQGTVLGALMTRRDSKAAQAAWPWPVPLAHVASGALVPQVIGVGRPAKVECALLFRGGQGATFSMTNTCTGARCALKLILPYGIKDASSMYREWYQLARLTPHPNIQPCPRVVFLTDGYVEALVGQVAKATTHDAGCVAPLDQEWRAFLTATCDRHRKLAANRAGCWCCRQGPTRLHAALASPLYDMDLFGATQGDSRWPDAAPVLPPSVDNSRLVFCQLLRALAHMHAQGVSHRDVRLENVLYDVRSQAVVLADFGFATGPAWSDRRVVCHLPEEYRSPGMVAFHTGGAPQYDCFQADVWAAGVTAFLPLMVSLELSASHCCHFMAAWTRRPLAAVPKLSSLLHKLFDCATVASARTLLSHPWCASASFPVVPVPPPQVDAALNSRRKLSLYTLALLLMWVSRSHRPAHS
jgi:hypothetical protein